MDVAILIVNSIASLTAVVGLIITCVQFSKTMKAQNRSINVSLFDLRMEILECVENGKLIFDRTKAQLLFDSDITEKISGYDASIREYRRYCGLKREFVNLLQRESVDDTYKASTDLLAEIQQYDVTDPDSPQYQQLQERIRSKEYTERWMNGTQLFELETINYVDVQEQTLSFHSKAEAERKEIIAAMKQFIQKSIQ